MPDPIQSVTFHDAVTQAYRAAVAKHGNTERGINRQDAIAHAMTALIPRLESGELSLPYEDALHAALMQADSREGSTADSILAKIARGDIGLSIWPDPLLDVVVVLGGGRRKAWKHVTPDDLADMAELRSQNTRAARRSERRFLRDVTAVQSALILAGTVGEMVQRQRAEALFA